MPNLSELGPRQTEGAKLEWLDGLNKTELLAEREVEGRYEISCEVTHSILGSDPRYKYEEGFALPYYSRRIYDLIGNPIKLIRELTILETIAKVGIIKEVDGKTERGYDESFDFDLINAVGRLIQYTEKTKFSRKYGPWGEKSVSVQKRRSEVKTIESFENPKPLGYNIMGYNVFKPTNFNVSVGAIKSQVVALVWPPDQYKVI